MKKKQHGVIILTAAMLAGIAPSVSSKLVQSYLDFSPKSVAFVPFVDPLPIPQRLVISPDETDVTIHLNEFALQLHRDFKLPTIMWGYNGSSPGPVIEVEKDQKVRIHWKNDLPLKHILKAPSGMMSMGPTPESRVVMNGPQAYVSKTNFFKTLLFEEPSESLPEVRNVTHLHGAVVEEKNPLDRHFNSDGWPDSWTVPGEEQIAEYPNRQDARTLFYHDHAVGETGRNVAAGLAGVYIIHDQLERSLNLPNGKYEIPIIFQSTILDADGNRSYTARVDNEFFGNSVLVNGKLAPYLDVEPRKYRFRIVNAANARAFGLSLVDQKDNKTPGPGFYQIASDSGFLQDAVLLNDPNDPHAPQLFLSSAERADIIVDFSKYAGRNFLLVNKNAITDPDGEIPIPVVMQFKVGTAVSETDTSSLPTHIRDIEKLKPEDATTTRQIILSQTDRPDGSTLFQINKRPWIYQKTDDQGKEYWDYETEQKSIAGTTEVWQIVNASILMHPFHVHLVQFQILDRRPFDVDKFNQTGEIVYTGDATPPDANEAGWKDVVRASKRQVTRIIMRFDPEMTGYYVYHCHILEHEDMDMMVPFEVTR